MEGTAGTTLLGLGGFVLLEARVLGGEVELLVETTADRVGCPGCGVIARLHDRREVLVRDLPVAGRPSRLCWRKRVWRCEQPPCGQRTWTETSGHIGPRRALTERARAEIARRVGQDGDAVAEVARAFGVSWHTAMDAVGDHGQDRVEDPTRLAGVTALGMDETSWLKATRTHPTLYVSGLVDTATGRLLDVVPDRTAKAVADWLTRRDRRWLASVGIVTLDPHRGFANAVGVHLGHATLVVDHFHAVMLGNRAVDDARRRVQQHTLGHRGRKRDPLFRVRKLLVTAADRLDARGWTRLARALRDGDPDGQVAAVWQAKELLRDVYLDHDLRRARATLAAFYDHAGGCGVPEARRLAGTVRRWEAEILAWHATGGASNGPTEATNLAIKRIKRVGRGFRNFDNYRLRLLLHCGVDWHTHQTVSITGHTPRSAA